LPSRLLPNLAVLVGLWYIPYRTLAVSLTNLADFQAGKQNEGVAFDLKRAIVGSADGKRIMSKPTTTLGSRGRGLDFLPR